MTDKRGMLSRRQILAASGAMLALGTAGQRVLGKQLDSYFSLGVASGSPREDRVILWTRLAPDPLNGGGMPPEDVTLRVRVAKDEALRNVIIDEPVTAAHEHGHSVHFSAQGLERGREYWYQFHLGDEDSPIGRTKTSDPTAAQARIALAYCQHYEYGYYAAYRDLADWQPDCVIHTGDYIYEGGPSRSLGPTLRDVGGGERRLFEVVRLHDGPEIRSLWDYRNRYALYRSDPDLQAAHAAAPWIVAMDDHEVDNNWAGSTPQDPEKQTEVEFLVRKIAAFQAYYEHMPIERSPVLDGLISRLRMYDVYRFGPAQVHLLDTRQFRSNQTCGDGRKVQCDKTFDPARTMLGVEQESWLADSLRGSVAPFNVIASQIWFTPYRYNEPPTDPVVNLDSWDGYPAARERLSNVLASGVSNPVFLTGDWHTAVASTVYQNPFDTKSKRLGHELAGSSISSGCPWARDMEAMRDANPHVAHLNGNQRGYLRTTISKTDCRAEFRVVKDAGVRESPVLSDIELRTSEI